MRVSAATLAAPIGFAAVAGNAQVALSWSPVAGAQYYSVYQSAASGGPFTDVANLTTTAVTESGLANGKTYYYYVLASNYVIDSPDSATLSATPSTGVAGGSPGALSVTSSSDNVTQSAGVVNISVARTGGSSTAVSIHYATANGTAVAGTDYTATSGTLSWASGDTSLKTFAVTLDDPASYSGTRAFTVALSAPTGGAALGSPSSATVTITGMAAASACAQNSSSWLDSSEGGNAYDYKQYGNYLVYVDNWGSLPGQTTWANGSSCFGANASASNTDVGYPRSYPHVTRGWAESGSILNLSTPGTYDWTTKSGLGIAVPELTKALMHWTFQAPTVTGSRWDALADIYFHTSAAPAPTSWPPYTDLQVIQSLADQVVGNSTYYALVASGDHASTVTIGGNTYVLFIDDSGGSSFHQPGGHTIALFNLPTALTSDNANPNWGVTNAVTDLAAIIHYLMQSNPKDNSGNPVLNAAGVAVTSPLIPSNLYLTAINAGWEIDVGATFINTGFCVAMQNEQDCP